MFLVDKRSVNTTAMNAFSNSVFLPPIPLTNVLLQDGYHITVCILSPEVVPCQVFGCFENPFWIRKPEYISGRLMPEDKHAEEFGETWDVR